MKFYNSTNNRGSALVFMILILFILSVLGSVLVSITMTNFKISKHSNDYETTYSLAEGMAEELILTADGILFYAASATQKSINGDSSSYIISTKDKGETTYSLKEGLEGDIYYDFLGYVRYGTEDDEEDDAFVGLYEIDAYDLDFVSDSDFSGNSDYEFEIEEISVVPNKVLTERDSFKVTILVEATYLSLKRSIQLISVVQFSCNPTLMNDNITIATDINATMDYENVSWQETNINE
ncbi:MAG: hypothetical protein JJE29_04970 [Peptostreptococcaceae bacterium]|nr:hypothetical protein [Peptostreptococcaceae bacterium]